jgi:predicted Zn-dependent protease
MMLERAPEAAGATAQASLNLNPGNVLALRIRVRAHVALGEAEPLPALGDLLLKAAPDRGWGALAHGVYHVLKKERVAATSWLTRAEGDPDVGTLLTVAAVWLSMPRMANAARVFNAVLAQDPTNVSAEIGLAMTALARRDFMAAETGLMRALKVDPGRAAAYLQLAQVYARSGRKHEAARAARFALRLGVAPAMAAAAKAGRLRG